MKQYILLLISLISIHAASAQIVTKTITTNWQFKQIGKSKWHKAAVPGTVHTDLLTNKLISDPFFGTNESQLQWISKADWEYKTTFEVDEKSINKKLKALIFEGLDTYADVYLNGQKILSADNMFRTWKVDVTNIIQSNQNELRIFFKSADRMADSLAALSNIKYPCENNRNYIRKAQYHFGWDFAPKLTTCGIWRTIKLAAWDEITSPKTNNKKADWNINLIQEKDSIGQSFYFTVNGKPKFIKGANWVPADVFLPSISNQKYRNLLVAAKAAGINMLRVWGGGIYEADIFYELCDSLGIMVWQDFMFAGAMYPGDDHFIENVKQEVKDNLQRLSKHPCIVVWCGNNEINEAWHNWGWQKQYRFSPSDSAKIWNDYQKLFHDIIPNLVKQFSQQPYITTSPLNGWGRKESMTHGDSHYWGVWWGLQPIETYQQKIPRFMSEYGMQSLPNFESIQEFSNPKDWDTSSAVMKAHQKHPTGYQTLAVYLKQNKLQPNNFKQYINATQVVQAKAMEIAITAHVKAQPYCMGTLFWQFNDCWPGASWSVIDYYGRKKKAYYTVQRLYKKSL
jgi:beta-mannosidase